MEKWIYDEEEKCIRCNSIPILEGSYHNEDCKNALLLAQKAPEMLEMLKSILASEHLKGTIEESKVKQLIKSATEL